MNSSTFVRQSLAQRGPQRTRRRSKNRLERAGDRISRVIGTFTDKIMPQREESTHDDEDDKPFEARKTWNRVLEVVTDKVRRDKRLGAQLKEPLQAAINKGWNTRHHSSYLKVHVLLTYWADDDDAKDAANQLDSLFRDKYGFNVFIFPLRVDNPEPAKKLAGLLKSFMEIHGKKDNLLIFWYGGAAHLSGDGRGRTMWFGRGNGNMLISSGLVTKTLAGLLEAPPCDADILTLFDAQHSINDMVSSAGSGIFEHLGASANVDLASWKYNGCFTRSLIDILGRQEVIRHGISVPDLHRELIQRAGNIRRDISELQSRQNLNSTHSQNVVTRYGYMARTPPPPVYCRLSPLLPRSKNKSGSVVLSQLDRQLEYFSVSPDNEDIDVQLIVKSNNDRLDFPSWRTWLQNAPPQVEKIRVRRIEGSE
ncbi:hypothetical protein PFICI_13715 [Pestalotiopsis fici W106-1]|uniref:Uncharacterized protein n=1 Tax=Pestalotiopsis fici (strain W106-1 / CGMCC3.15140) TaxID=1229662 RepID=W3WQZ2_PESFW|nr:uncharacterized protein PFICI_13715 [Pestalotiopsis fici W106-1]ETS75231.1 hypothetical protein PFICI_13715 [Pestalotiopsis fici W106-1]